MLFRRKNHKSLTSSARLAHGRLTNLINSMADGVIALDRNLNVVVYNGAALNILDRNGSVEGKNISKLFQPIDKSGNPIDIMQLIREVKTPTINTDLKLKYADTSIINLYLSIVPVHQGYGSSGQQGYVLVLRDITREKSLDEERDEFISVVSHELRTPIAIAEGNIGNAQFVAQKSGDISQITQALEQAHNQILFLSDLVNDLSMFSRAEGGKLTLSVEAIDVPVLLEELGKSYRDQAEAKGLQLLTRAGEGLKEPLYSARLYVREVLQNFITNSLKYTEKGSVTIAAVGTAEGISFSVTDTGIGISHGDQKRVFDKFFRSEDYRTRKTNGTGLGLYVTAKLAKLLKAEISLKSELNKGSTFTIFIPNLPKPTEEVKPPIATTITSSVTQAPDH